MRLSLTVADAREKRLCPLARTFGGTLSHTCRGDDCPVWRWTTNQKWRDAVMTVARETGEKVPFPNAASKVTSDPAAHGCEGHCGLGGGV